MVSDIFPDHFLSPGRTKWEKGYEPFEAVRYCKACGIELEDKREKGWCIYCRLEADGDE